MGCGGFGAWLCWSGKGVGVGRGVALRRGKFIYVFDFTLKILHLLWQKETDQCPGKTHDYPYMLLEDVPTYGRKGSQPELNFSSLLRDSWVGLEIGLLQYCSYCRWYRQVNACPSVLGGSTDVSSMADDVQHLHVIRIHPHNNTRILTSSGPD